MSRLLLMKGLKLVKAHECGILHIFVAVPKLVMVSLWGKMFLSAINVHLSEGVFCGPSMVFTNVYNPRSLIERKDQYRDTIVKKGATLGANSTIVCGVTIGEFAFVGAGAVINKNVPAYALMVGVPAKQIGWMSEFGEQLDLPLEGEGCVTCPHTGSVYRLDGKQLIKD